MPEMTAIAAEDFLCGKGGEVKQGEQKELLHRL
jgi:hypothetical protein